MPVWPLQASLCVCVCVCSHESPGVQKRQRRPYACILYCMGPRSRRLLLSCTVSTIRSPGLSLPEDLGPTRRWANNNASRCSLQPPDAIFFVRERERENNVRRSFLVVSHWFSVLCSAFLNFTTFLSKMAKNCLSLERWDKNRDK